MFTFVSYNNRISSKWQINLQFWLFDHFIGHGEKYLGCTVCRVESICHICFNLNSTNLLPSSLLLFCHHGIFWIKPLIWKKPNILIPKEILYQEHSHKTSHLLVVFDLHHALTDGAVVWLAQVQDPSWLKSSRSSVILYIHFCAFRL